MRDSLSVAAWTGATRTPDCLKFGADIRPVGALGEQCGEHERVLERKAWRLAPQTGPIAWAASPIRVIRPRLQRSACTSSTGE